EQREREFLKTALLLFNNGKLNRGQYGYYLLAFVYGNGKTSVESWSWKNIYQEFKDGPGAIKFYVDRIDASVESAIHSLIEKMDDKDKIKLTSGDTWLDADDVEGSVFKNESNYKLSLGHLENSESILHYSGEG